MNRTRSSGILLHPASLPGPFGVGDLGRPACRFVDFLQDTGQGLWQILPLGPAGYGNSPYMCFSAFAGNPLLISPEQLVEEGLLDPSDIASPPSFAQDRVDYGPVIEFKLRLLKTAFHRFQRKAAQGYPADFYTFCDLASGCSVTLLDQEGERGNGERLALV